MGPLRDVANLRALVSQEVVTGPLGKVAQAPALSLGTVWREVLEKT